MLDRFRNLFGFCWTQGGDVSIKSPRVEFLKEPLPETQYSEVVGTPVVDFGACFSVFVLPFVCKQNFAWFLYHFGIILGYMLKPIGPPLAPSEAL